MKKLFYILPSLITSISVFSGFTSLIYTSQGYYKRAAWLIILAIFMDALDGKVARLTRKVSKFGEEYDSLADTMSFGMAPSFLIYNIMVNVANISQNIALPISFLVVLCGALRLARFNVSDNKSGNFQGMPIPGAAGIISSYILFCYKYGFQFKTHFLIFIAIWVSFLMVSNLPYFSGKKKKQSPITLKIIVLSIMTLGLVTRYHVEFFALLGLLYAFYGPVAFICFKVSELAKHH
ncbi:MAG: CDP-diacylglycerol--serine O-phosphatidyltransferase [Candidatus Muirbacterium halophilum]|nr:CDP-diacylglycerol--serine O-phosphatidyltransferase [Candidatus Muirbacterium halophilum]MCK9475844.1 CDP-diacylglycerol--serine O-phosphatidyltransferase [Candidatus Muirbacterium halophilum]